jgi:hypothetical protein
MTSKMTDILENYAKDLTKGSPAWSWINAKGDEWCGNWGPDGSSFLAYVFKERSGLFSVACCGNDDMACYHRNLLEVEAVDLLELLQSTGCASQKELRLLGFVFEV